MLLNEIEMADPDLSVQELKKQLFTSLQCTGILDSLKSQLRARLLDHLREQDGSLLEIKDKDRKPSVTERLLSSLFLDYLNSFGYAFTQSVFLPESRMVSWPPYTYQEILQLLHLDSTSTFNHRLKIAPDGKGCLMQQLVMVLQKCSFRITTHDASIQTQDLDSCLREIDDACYKKQEAERRLALCSLEDRFNAFRQEFESRVNGEVALQVNRVREYETNALRVEEACRYRRQLAKDREELEELHKARLERIHEREESLMERLLVKEKAIEASAYEQRQKLLADITSFRDRDEKLQEREELQVRREEKLSEHEKYLKLREEDICHMRETLYARVDESAEMRLKELEDQYRSKNEQLQLDRALLEAEWVAFNEEKARLANELRAAKVDKELVISLHERLASEGEQRQFLLDKIENLCVEDVHQICQQQQQKWTQEHKKMQKTTNKLEADVKNALEEKEAAVRSRKTLQVQLRHSESELLDTVTLLKKTQHALELERLHHYSLRSQIATYFSGSSQDKLQEKQVDANLADRPRLELSEEIAFNTCEPGAIGRTSQSVDSLEGKPGERCTKTFADMVSQHLSSSRNSIRTKFYSLAPSRPYSDKSVLAQEGKTASNTFPRETGLEEVRVQDHTRMRDGVKTSSLRSPRGERVDSSGTDICSSNSKSKQINMPRVQRWGKTSESCKGKTDKDCFHPTTSEASSQTSQKSGEGAPMSSLPPTNTRKPQRAKQQTPSAATWEPNQISTNYYMMGATSLKSSTSAVEFKMMGKAVKLSTSVDPDRHERRHTEVYEAKFQQNIQKKSADADRDRQRCTQVAPEFQEQSARLLTRSQESETRGKLVYEDNQPSEDTFSGELSGARRRKTSRRAEFREQQELQEMRTAEKERQRPYSQALELSGHCNGEHTRKAQGFLEQHTIIGFPDVGIEVNHQKGVASLEQNRLSEPRAQSPENEDNEDREVNAHGLSAMVLKDLKRFSQQLEVSRSLLAIEKPQHTESSGLRTNIEPRIEKSGSSKQQQARLHNDEELEMTTAGQLLGGIDLLESVNAKHDPPADQNENVLELQYSSTGHSSSQDHAVQTVAGRGFTRKSSNAEGANSEESCNNPRLQAPTVRNTSEVSDIRENASEVNENLQEGDHTAKQRTQQWDVQSEQGSHNPEDETMEWVDDYATGDIDQYVEYSDAFSVPESNNSPSNESATAGYS